MKNTAIIVAGGRGTRMGSAEPKQFLPILGKPMLAHTLAAFEESEYISEIILVVPKDEIGRTMEEIVGPEHLSKVIKVTAGGKERYDSVYAGLCEVSGDCGYVFVHDGARPCVSGDVIRDAYDTAVRTGACIAAVPEVDTVRMVSQDSGTDAAGPLLDRSVIRRVQTPQTFSCGLLKEAYERFFENPVPGVTDDASVVELMTGHPVYFSQGSPRNIKVTTPEDLIAAEAFLSDKGRNE